MDDNHRSDRADLAALMGLGGHSGPAARIELAACDGQRLTSAPKLHHSSGLHLLGPDHGFHLPLVQFFHANPQLQHL